jgi:hypothetical protein
MGVRFRKNRTFPTGSDYDRNAAKATFLLCNERGQERENCRSLQEKAAANE